MGPRGGRPRRPERSLADGSRRPCPMFRPAVFQPTESQLAVQVSAGALLVPFQVPRNPNWVLAPAPSAPL